jgi:hypothetical protein
MPLAQRAASSIRAQDPASREFVRAAGSAGELAGAEQRGAEGREQAVAEQDPGAGPGAQGEAGRAEGELLAGEQPHLGHLRGRHQQAGQDGRRHALLKVAGGPQKPAGHPPRAPGPARADRPGDPGPEEQTHELQRVIRLKLSFCKRESP